MPDTVHRNTSAARTETPPDTASGDLGEQQLLVNRALAAVRRGNLEAAQELIDSAAGAMPTLGEVFRLYQTELETQALQLSDSQLRTEQTLDWFANLFRTLPVAALLVDGHGHIVDANRLALDELDLSDALRILPVPLRRLMASTNAEIRLAELLPRVVTGSTESMDDVELRTLHGRTRWADLRITQLPPREAAASGSAAVYLCVLNDRTARVEAQRAGEAAAAAEHRRDLAESANRTKSELLSRVSHELRTPLNAVIGFSHLLLMNPHLAADPESQRRLTHIRDAGQHLLALVDEVLQINRTEAGHLPLQIEAVPVTDLARGVLELHQPMADPLALTLTLDAPPAEPDLCVLADARRLREVLINLVSNAIKYNRIGGWVRLTIETIGAGVRISVDDNGIGMTEAQLAHLFEPFNRLGADRLKVAGHGLGLSIARALSEAMGGSLRVSSQQGSGSSFVLELTRAATPAR
jgi:signal transduction histidine kinase